MRQLIIAEIVSLETVDFLSLVLYGTGGFYLDSVIKPYSGVERQIVDEIRELLRLYKLDDCELHTSNKTVYVMSQSVVGIAVDGLKHSSDTRDAARRVNDVRELLIELYDVPLLMPPPEPQKLPKWKSVLIDLLRKTITKLEGEM